MGEAWGGIAPRRWQAEALPIVLAAVKARVRGIVSAIMGSGKSILIAEVCAAGRGRVLITVPTIALVEQLSATVRGRLGEDVGCYYTHQKQANHRVTIACMDSVPKLLADPAWPGPPALWIADEAHQTEQNRMLCAYQLLQPERALGFTATPFRTKQGEELSLWTQVVYEYGATAALRDGVVVPYHLRHWEGAEVSVDEACRVLIRSAVDEAGPGLVNATDCADADQYAHFLRQGGIAAEAVHSRRGREANTLAIAALRGGQLQALVHVNMLTEGVDLPWLNWLCMRRLVGSRVRFCQEVGRVLRAFPGKERALLLDPHDLLNVFGLTYEAVLQGQGDADEPEADPFARAVRKVQASLNDWDMDPAARTSPPVELLAAWRGYLRRLYHAALAAGMVEARMAGMGWRSREPSPKQVAATLLAVQGLQRDTSVPIAHRRAIAQIQASAYNLTRGDVSDFLAVNFALRDGRRRAQPGWPQLAAALQSTSEAPHE